MLKYYGIFVYDSYIFLCSSLLKAPCNVDPEPEYALKRNCIWLKLSISILRSYDKDNEIVKYMAWIIFK